MAYKQIRRRMKQEVAENEGAAPEVNHAPEVSQIQTDRDLMTADDAMALQDLVGNRATGQMMGATPLSSSLNQGGKRGVGYVQPKPTPPPMLRRESSPNRPAYAHIMRKLELQRAGGDGSFETNDSFESKVKQQSGGGKPLPSDVRADLEPKFGADFSGVRVHADANAAQLSQDVGAQAFTHGSDIYFNQGKYNPESGSGQHLLAHELTHTVQQGGAVGRADSVQTKLTVGADTDVYGQEAEQMASLVQPTGNKIQTHVVQPSEASGVIHRKIEKGKLNIVGEYHDESEGRRGEEKNMVEDKYDFLAADQYWQENQFTYTKFGETKSGDSLHLLLLQSAAFLLQHLNAVKWETNEVHEMRLEGEDDVEIENTIRKPLIDKLEQMIDENEQFGLAIMELSLENESPDLVNEAININEAIDKNLPFYVKELNRDFINAWSPLLQKIQAIESDIHGILAGYDAATTAPKEVATQIVKYRSLNMYVAAEAAAEENGTTGVWKVGDEHADDLNDSVTDSNSARLTLTSRADFNAELEAWRLKKAPTP